MTGMGPSFWERQWDRVRCPECKVELASGSLDSHRQAYKRKERLPQWEAPLTTPGTSLYMVYFPIEANSIGCPVGECKGRAATRTKPRIHFVHRHIWDTVVIMEEGNRTCDMFIP